MMTLHDRSRHDVVAETSHAGRMIMELFLTRTKTASPARELKEEVARFILSNDN